MLTFQLNFVHEAYLINLFLLSLGKYPLKENGYNFSEEYSSIDKSDILNILNICLLNKYLLYY